MTTTKSKTNLQFSLRALMILITAACVVLAFPESCFLLAKGAVLVSAVGAVWMLLGAAIAWVLIKFYVPIYRFLSGVELDEKGK